MSEADLDKLSGSQAGGHLIIPVFGISKYPLGASNNNPNIIALTTKDEDEKDLCANMVVSRGVTRILFPTLKYHDDCREVSFNGATFGMQELSIPVGSRTIRQTQYNYLNKHDYLITFTLAYFDIADKDILDGIMRSISFAA